MIIEKSGYKFDVDVDSTREYYKSNSVCNCAYCRNFAVQIEERLPKLKAFLEEFGADISRPDETAPYCNDVDKTVDYCFACYTVCGKVLHNFDDLIEIDGDIRIGVNIELIPNEQETDNYFSLAVYHIILPWSLDEPFPKVENEVGLIGRIKKFFNK